MLAETMLVSLAHGPISPRNASAMPLGSDQTWGTSDDASPCARCPDGGSAAGFKSARYGRRRPVGSPKWGVFTRLR